MTTISSMQILERSEQDLEVLDQSKIDTVIIVLGAPNDENGKLSVMALARLDLAVDLVKKYKGSGLLLTGGLAPHANPTGLPHALFAKRYVLQDAALQGRVLPIIESNNTIEDATLSYPFLKSLMLKKLLVVTSCFHLERAKLIFNSVFDDVNLEFRGAEHPVDEDMLFHERRAVRRLERLGVDGYYKVPFDE